MYIVTFFVQLIIMLLQGIVTKVGGMRKAQSGIKLKVEQRALKCWSQIVFIRELRQAFPPQKKMFFSLF